MLSQHNRQLFKELKRLKLPKDEFAVFGTGPMGIRGLKEISDIDLIVTKNLWRKLCQKYPFKKIGKNKKITIGNIEIFSDWYPGKWNIQKLIDEADIIDNIRFVKLKKVLKWKEIFNRPKDQEAIRLLKRHLF